MTDVLILGASARAAIHSARRAGLTPHAADLFADRDATAYATVHKCDLADYPDGLERLADTFPPMPWMYTGGLENHPDLVDRIAAKRPLWGNCSGVLRRVRGKGGLTLLTADMDYPPVPHFETDEDGDPRMVWLRKSYGSSGGLGVSWATDLAPRIGTYLQEFVAGPNMSVAVQSFGRADTVLGLTEQLVSTDWLHAKPFQYAGSIGRLPPDDGLIAKVEYLVALVTNSASLRNSWGLDIVVRYGEPILIEINPRYTASMEVLEHATGRSVLDCVQRREPIPGVVGKAVYYAPHALRFPEVAAIEHAIEVAADPWALPEYADIPAVGSVIDAGQPVLSFFERAADAEACRAALKRRAAELDALFARHRVEVAS